MEVTNGNFHEHSKQLFYSSLHYKTSVHLMAYLLLGSLHRLSLVLYQGGWRTYCDLICLSPIGVGRKLGQMRRRMEEPCRECRLVLITSHRWINLVLIQLVIDISFHRFHGLAQLFHKVGLLLHLPTCN